MIIEIWEEKLFALINEGHEAVINKEEVDEYRKKIKDFIIQLVQSQKQDLKNNLENRIKFLGASSTIKGALRSLSQKRGQEFYYGRATGMEDVIILLDQEFLSAPPVKSSK